MNKKSFLCGVFVGVLVTWAVSFYLYFSLDNSLPSKLTTLQKNIFNFDDDSGESDEDLKNSNSLSDRDAREFEGKAAYAKGKALKKKKISQKLMQELTPVTIKQQEEFGIIKSIDDQFTRDSGYKTHAFNILVSNNIGNFRDIPDTRHKT